MTRLLVSVRSAAEAEAALLGGADLIDVKEPNRGALGRADDHVLAAVIERVAGRRPVSAALGELRYGVPEWPSLPKGVTYCKFGLAGLGRQDWRTALTWAERRMAERWGCITVAVAYADWMEVDAPPPDEVCAYARQRGGVFLLDTCLKASDRGGRRRTLLDLLPVRRLALLCRLCRAAGVSVALAGSIGVDEIRRLLPAAPDWFAVRGAACREDSRLNAVDAERVGRLVELLAAAGTSTSGAESRLVGKPGGLVP
jgi:uncharacterized protein (UPF0264 family)